MLIEVDYLVLTLVQQRTRLVLFRVTVVLMLISKETVSLVGIQNCFFSQRGKTLTDSLSISSLRLQVGQDPLTLSDGGNNHRWGISVGQLED